jgi:hypothetical protein
MELVNITYAGEGSKFQDLSPLDKQLVATNYINSQFGAREDYLELYIYDENNNLLDFDYDAFDYYPYLTANPQNQTYSNLTLDPEKDLKNRGFNRGRLNIQYNFYKKLFNSSFGSFYWIKEISNSRTELKLASQTISSNNIRNGLSIYQSYISSKNYYPVFYLNFGSNKTILASNVAYTEDDSGGYLLIKLYEPLPSEYDLKTQLWIIDKVAESVSFDVDINVESSEIIDDNRLRGPNFNIKINNRVGQSTPYYNYNTLLASPVSSSFQKLYSYYQDKSVAINLDFSDFKNFIHFSSAEERVRNFVYKLGLIEDYNSEIASQASISGGSGNSQYIASSVTAAQNAINNIIEKFDIYEYFLYFESSSWAWPKSNSTQPYSLYSVTSSQASNFLGDPNIVPTLTTQSLLFSASYYDVTNKDLLRNSAPQYLLDDSTNAPYVTFLDMIGQHFDNVWVYYKDLSNRYNATNNPDTGISIDVVGDALRGLGIQLYTNSNISDNLYYTLFGINPDGSLLPPVGDEIISKYVTSSLATLPAKTIQQELYKRIYHNLPYLLKTKGTERGVKALISTFGIPDEILTVREFGGTPINSVDGIFDLDSGNYKLQIITGSNGNVTGGLELSSSLLHPEVTLQYYKNTNRLNSTNIEVGFSPADTINTNIVSSSGYFNIDSYIGKPYDQYTTNYYDLEFYRRSVFSSYNKKNSIWEYIRLIKFYNNSLFKMIKDFVPARANLSTGIIVKSHMLERNKYARHEPDGKFENNYSESIDMISIEGSSGGSVNGNTSWVGTTIYISGSIPISSSKGIEKYNGEFSGSYLQPTNGQPFDQTEISSTSTGSIYGRYSLGALYQNISTPVRSQKLFDLDYSTNQLTPVNLGLITKSLSESINNNYNTYTNINNPYAYVQDYNYNLQRSLLPRYSGSKTISSLYTTYTPGDQSYGKTAAIDKIKYQYAYLVDIYGASIYLPNRSNAQIKYLIDNDQNVLDLTKANVNIFQVQNIYKSGETTDISLFQYDESNPYSQLLANNPTLRIYEGGFRYLPILHNISGSATTQSYTLNDPIQSIIYNPGGGAVVTDPYLNPSNYYVYWVAEENDFGDGNSSYTLYASASYTGTGTPPYNVSIQISSYYDTSNGTCDFPTKRTAVIEIASGQTVGVGYFSSMGYNISSGNGNGSSIWGGLHWPGSYPNCSITVESVYNGTTGATGSYATYYTTYVTSSQPCLYYISQSNELVFNDVISYYYNSNGITFNSISDPGYTASLLDRVVLPFTINQGDRISLYDSSSMIGWSEKSEYVVKSAYITGSGVTGSRLLVQLSTPVNLALLNSGGSIPIDSVTKAPYRTCRYIVWKHVPDETNVMLRYDPKDSSLIENGLLFPQYIDEKVKENSGNTVKALKSQNLIQGDTNTLIFQ